MTSLADALTAYDPQLYGAPILWCREEAVTASGTSATVVKLTCGVLVSGAETRVSLIAKRLISRPVLSAGQKSVAVPTEVAFYSSDLPAQLRGVCVPRCYGHSCREPNCTVLYLEHIAAVAGDALDDYALIARCLGRMNATFGTSPKQELWMARRILSWWPDRSTAMLASMAATCGLSRSDTERLFRVASKRTAYLEALDSLPQVLCHNDASRRNALVCQGSRDREVTLIDWEWIGLGAVGSDIAQLVGASALFSDPSGHSIAALESVSLHGYVAGLGDGRLQMKPSTVWLGYAAASTIRLLRRAMFIGRLAREPELQAKSERQFACAASDLVERFRSTLAHHLDLALAVLEVIEGPGRPFSLV